jgi:hypothetical protein
VLIASRNGEWIGGDEYPQKRSDILKYHYLKPKAVLQLTKMNPHIKRNNLNFPKHHTQAPKIHGETSKSWKKKARQPMSTGSITKVSISMTGRSD